MKRFYQPHFKDMYRTVLVFGQILSQAGVEWANANILLKHGIETYRPVCYGFKRNYGLEKCSFFVTEKLHSQCLTDHIKANWQNMAMRQKHELIIAIAKVVRKIHDLGIDMPDLYMWHFFVSENDGQYEFALIDLHRMKKKRPSRNAQIRNVASLFYSMVDKYIDEERKKPLLKKLFG